MPTLGQYLVQSRKLGLYVHFQGQNIRAIPLKGLLAMWRHNCSLQRTADSAWGAQSQVLVAPRPRPDTCEIVATPSGPVFKAVVDIPGNEYGRYMKDKYVKIN